MFQRLDDHFASWRSTPQLFPSVPHFSPYLVFGVAFLGLVLGFFTDVHE